MNKEIERVKAWKRGFMPLSGTRGSLLQLHMWHYHDELLRDAGINPKRKSNVLAEWLQDYRPSDYRQLLQKLAIKPR